MLKQRSSVQSVWYESDRAAEEAKCDSWLVRASNFLLLVVMIALMSGPLWMFVPWSLTPWESVLGKLRYAAAILGCHVGLVLLPCAYFLFRILLRQKRWIERIKVTALLVICLWFFWGGAREVFYFWRWVAIEMF